METLPIPLYHGTSTLFLTGIVESGLGGKNPIADWKILEFAAAIHPLVQEHFSRDEGWMVKAQSFGFMVEQKSAAMNFQHGDTYLSPSLATAARYAINKRFGSELLTYALVFLDELIRRKVPGVVDKLYRRFPHVFGFLDISCAPLLVRINRAPINILIDEHGGDASHNLNQVATVMRESRDMADVLLQQTNFRLRQSMPVAELTFWLINVGRWHSLQPEYSLHLLSIPGARNDDAQPAVPGDGPRAAPEARA